MSERLHLLMPGDADPLPCEIWQRMNPHALNFILTGEISGRPEFGEFVPPTIRKVAAAEILTPRRCKLLENQGESGRALLDRIERHLAGDERVV